MAVSLGHAHGEISVGTKGVRDAESVVHSASAKMQRDLEGTGKGAIAAQRSFGQMAGGAMQFGIAAGVVVASVVAVGRAANSLATTASDLTESINKTGVAFASSKDEILQWSKTSASALGQSRQQALEGASSFGLLFNTMGLAPKVSAEMSMALVQLATDMASINNISPEDALTKLRAGLVGEVEPLRTVGVLLNSVAVEAKAVEMGLAPTTDALTEQNKVMARYQLILEQTKLTQGDFARTSGEFANQQRIAAAAAKDAEAALGEVIQQDVLETTQAYTNMLKDLTFWLAQIRGEGGGKSVGTAMLQAGGWKLPGQKEAEAAAKEVEDLTGMLGRAQEGLAILQDQAAQGLVDEAQVQRQIQLIEDFKRAIQEASAAAAATPVAVGGGGVPAWMTGVSRAASGPLRSDAEVAERRQPKLDWARGVTEVNQRLHDDILSEESDFGRQRASTVRDYNKGVARDERDFGRQRLRAEMEHLDAIAGVLRDAGRREAAAEKDLARTISRSQADSAERIGDARKDAGERLVEMEEDFAKDRERAAEDHRDKMMSAAGRLDAVALLEERKRWARESSDAKEAHEEQRDDLQEQLAERIADENESLAESIADAQEAHQRQLEEGRENDRLRLEEMKADFAKRKAQEDADRVTRLGDQAADHADQLAEMGRAHIARIQQIQDNARKEKVALQEAADAELIRLKLADEATKKRQEAKEKALEELWDKFHGHISKSLGGTAGGGAGGGRPTVPGQEPLSFASGGPVTATGLALVHRGEFVMPAPAMAAASGMGNNNSRSISIAQGAITVYGASGQDEELIGSIVEERLVRLLEAV